ncbi:hypothetical protein [Bradyrhizobium sp. URHD0069]|uniref:hypothetical protein n=1 Tax=Bradyrhizobium sp. URHD0069 TaxID=1380355 RepID=UPI000496D2E7|nr:hypothetical protein [Bradyrhizobium sp. URHD0069]
MLSRALSLATATLLIGCFAAVPAQAQNLEAGKSPSQIFAGTCHACHKSPRGLLKTVSTGSLPGFLRQHYTTSSDMASMLAAFLISNGATDTRHVGQPKQSKDATPEGRPAGPPDQLDRFGRRLRPAQPESQEAAKPDVAPPRAARPDADGLPSQAEHGRQGRNAKQLARPTEPPDAAKPAADDQAPAQAASERGPDGRKSATKKRGKPGADEPPKTDPAKTDDAARTEAAKGEPAKGEAVKGATPRSETAKGEDTKPEASKPSGEGKPETGKIETSKEPASGEAPALRADPVPAVTPAPPASPAVSAPAVVSPAQPASSAATASAPPPPAIAPAGPAVPPISQ